MSETVLCGVTVTDGANGTFAHPTAGTGVVLVAVAWSPA
jgi:hypothetical protein